MYAEKVPCLRVLAAVALRANYHQDAKVPQHNVDNLKITLLVLLRCNSDVSFPILGYLVRAKTWAIAPLPSKYVHVTVIWTRLRLMLGSPST